MQIIWDSSVSTANQALIQATIDEALFDFTFISTAWTVKVNANAGHGGKFEAITTASGPGQPATTEFAPGLFIPGDPLYVDEAFVKESVLHELGHVVTLGNLTTAQLADLATQFGIDFATQFYIPLGGNWTHAGVEAVAETFKDLFARPENRHFTNRTAFQLPRWAHWYFVGSCALAYGYKYTPLEVVDAGRRVWEGGQPTLYFTYYVEVPVDWARDGTAFILWTPLYLFGGQTAWGQGGDAAAALVDVLSGRGGIQRGLILETSELHDGGVWSEPFTWVMFEPTAGVVVSAIGVGSQPPLTATLVEGPQLPFPTINWPYEDDSGQVVEVPGEIAAGAVLGGVVR